MTQLSDKLNRATEGSRELDVLIAAEFDGRDVIFEGNTMLGRSRTPPHDTCLLGWIDPGKESRNFQEAPAKPRWKHYTTNLQDAVSLVPEGCRWDVQQDLSAAFASIDGKGTPRMATPALAMSYAAVIKASSKAEAA